MNQFKYDVFISYSRKDTKIANEIVHAFDQAGITYFIDRQGIGGGMEFPAVLAKAIKESKIFLFLASKNSYDSKFTQSEIVYAFNKKEKHDIIPYIIDGSTLPDELEFTFSSINWRRIEQHPIETTLVNDILLKTGKAPSSQHMFSDNTDKIVSAKKFKFTGKLLAQIILVFSVTLFIGSIILVAACKSFIINNQDTFTAIYLLSIFVLFIFVLIGIIRPKSLDLSSRREVLIFYLISFVLMFFATGVIASVMPK